MSFLSDQECRDIYNAAMEGDRSIISVTRVIEKAVLDKLGKQEPVGWLYDCHHKDSWGGVSREFSKFKLESTGRSNWKPLYAAPVVQQHREWVGLTKTVIGNQLRRDARCDIGMYRNGFKDGAKFAEVKLKEKNHG